MKTCSTCDKTKPLTDFALTRNKPRKHCKVCEYTARKEARKDQRDGAMRTCIQCKETKSLHQYELCESGRFSLKCKTCKEEDKKQLKTTPQPLARNYYNPFEWRTYVQPSFI